MKILEITFVQPIKVPGQPGLRLRATSPACDIVLEDGIVRMSAGSDVVCAPISAVLFYVPGLEAPKAKRSTK